jgi:type II secretory ATPase GspE/PulE/Tfp pilus assembly ATPase PilB-like protein
MGIEPFLISSTIVCVLAQRLVRRLCSCKITYKPLPEVLENLGLSAQEAASITFYKAVGCEECVNTGYRGRLAIFEIMEMTPTLAALTIARTDTMALRKQALEDGMTLLIHDGIRKIKMGLTTVEEVLSVATAQEGIEA